MTSLERDMILVVAKHLERCSKCSDVIDMEILRKSLWDSATDLRLLVKE